MYIQRKQRSNSCFIIETTNMYAYMRIGDQREKKKNQKRIFLFFNCMPLSVNTRLRTHVSNIPNKPCFYNVLR
jgi:hypothetical protein